MNATIQEGHNFV